MQQPEVTPLDPTPAIDVANKFNVRVPPNAFGEKIGEALEQAGSAMTNRALSMQAIQNESWARENAVNAEIQMSQATEQFRTLRGKNAIGGVDDFTRKMEETRNNILASAPNPVARNMLDADIARVTAYKISEAYAHVGQQTVQYNTDTALARIGLAQQTGATTDNPQEFKDQEGVVSAAIDDRARVEGWSPDKITAEKMNAVGGIYAQRAQELVAKDPISALKFYGDSQSKMTLEQRKAVESKLYPALVTTGGRMIGDQAADGSLWNTGGTANDAVSAAILGHEHGVTTSPQGAIGPGQIMPDTFKEWAKPGEDINNKEDNLAVHRRMIDSYMQKYDGDWRRVAVAYFSGPGNVAPKGSPTPWINNRHDVNESVEDYVNNVGSRMKSPAVSNPQNNVVGIGDSIAVGANMAAHGVGEKDVDPRFAEKGIDPQAVDEKIKALKPEELAGKQIVLSTGATNVKDEGTPYQGFIKQQILDLIAKGVNPANITVMPVSPKADSVTQANDYIKNLERMNPEFKGLKVGDIDPKFYQGGDGYHPSMAGYKDFVTRATGAPGSPAPAALTANSSEADIAARATLARNQAAAIANQYSGIIDAGTRTQLMDAAEQRVRTKGDQLRADFQKDQKDKYDTVVSGMLDPENLPKSVDELKSKSPDIAQAFDSLEPKTQRSVTTYLANAAKQKNNEWTQDRQDNYYRLLAELKTNPAQFAKEDVLSTDLQPGAMKQLQNEWLNVKKNMQADPNVSKALEYLKQTGGLSGMGMSTTPVDKAGYAKYQQFTGRLAEKMKDFIQASGGQQPKDEDVSKMTNQLLREVIPAGVVWGRGTKLFEVPDQDRQQITAARAKLGLQTTDDDIARAYRKKNGYND